MSVLAITEIGGEIRTAWDFRTEYLSDRTEYNSFYCPFCYTRLTACAILTDEEVKVSPYFSARHDGGHRFGCDGEPIIKDEKKSPKKNEFEPIMKIYPEKLISRPERKITKTIITSVPKVITKPEIDKARIRIGSLGKITPSTYLLRPIVEARNALLAQSYELQKINKWEEKNRNKWVDELLESMPLRLESDYKTNYHKAFSSARFSSQTIRKIYYGKGSVKVDENVILISSDVKNFNNKIERELIVKININNNLSVKMHKKIMDDLISFWEKSKKIKWYVYGVPKLQDESWILEIENLDLVYFKEA